MKLNLPTPPLPSIFIQQVKQKKFIKFSSEELISLNDRQKDSMAEILQLSNRLLEELFHNLRGNIGCIYSLNDTTSLLDMITSFASFACKVPSCKPILTTENTMCITKGRHPILSTLVMHEDGFIPNDTRCNAAENFHILTGANMSGKSTYIRQIALLVIMAHVGCFVTAESCTIRITDHIFSRIGTSDSLEDNASSFMVEMREMAYIHLNKTPRSLVIIDELGRGTSLGDACAIAWSCCEDLIISKCFTFFVTHFTQLLKLAGMYKNVRLSYLATEEDNNRLIFNHKLNKGIDTTENFGIKLAHSQAGFPALVIDYAASISSDLSRMQATQQNLLQAPTINEYHRIAQEIKRLRHSTLDEDDIRTILRQLKARLLQTRSQ